MICILNVFTSYEYGMLIWMLNSAICYFLGLVDKSFSYLVNTTNPKDLSGTVYVVGLYRMIIWPDIRPIILSDTGYLAIKWTENFFLTKIGEFLPTFLDLVAICTHWKGSKEVYLFEVRIICSTVYPVGYSVIWPAGYPENETGYRI